MSDARAELLDFLSDYATTLLECGATTVRIERNVMRLAEAYGGRATVSVYPRHVEVVMATGADGATAVRSKAIGRSGNDYAVVAALSKLSWNCFDRRPPLAAARRAYGMAVGRGRIPSGWVLLLASCANASFCRLFEGDGVSMLLVLAATACGFYVRGAMVRRWRVDVRVATVAAGCVSAVLSCAGYVFGWGGTPDVALATSVLYLVPGIPYLNAVSDLIHGHYICAVSRFLQAGVTTVCLSAGLYLGLLMMHIGMM